MRDKRVEQHLLVGFSDEIGSGLVHHEDASAFILIVLQVSFQGKRLTTGQIEYLDAW